MPLAYALPLATPSLLRVAPTRESPAQPPHLRVIPGLLGQETGPRAAELYERFGPAVYRRCRRLLRDQDAAADATQEVFLRLVRNGDALSTRSDLLPWLYRVATNHCYNVLRDARGHAEEQLEAFEEPSCTPAHSSPRARLVRRVLAQFDEVTQAIAVGIIVEGREAEELARQMGVSRRTISRKLDRFLEQARSALREGVPA